MILHRFCSEAEYEKFIKGETLENNTEHCVKFCSTSKGFCFFTEDPEEAKHWLSGNVDFDYCLTFAVPDGMVEPSRARYTRWSEDGKYEGSYIRDEFCCRRYSNSHFKLIRASKEFRNYAPNRSVLHKIAPNIFP